MFLDNFSIKQKLLFIILILVLSNIFFSFHFIQTFQINYVIATKVKSLTNTALLESQLVHEIQKERGLSAGFLSSAAKKFGNELNQQRKLTEEKQKKIIQYIDNNQSDLPNELNAIKIKEQLQSLNELRILIDNNQIIAIDAIAKYSSIIMNLIQISRLTMDKSIAFEEVYVSTKLLFLLTQIKENYGKMRANINRLATIDSVDFNGYQNVSNLYYNNNYLLEEFFKYATADLAKEFRDINSNKTTLVVFSTVEKILNSINKKGINISPKEWFETCTHYIDELAIFENKIANLINNIISKIEEKNRNNLIIYSVITILFLLISIFISFFIVIRVSSNINQCTQNIIQITKGIL